MEGRAIRVPQSTTGQDTDEETDRGNRLEGDPAKRVTQTQARVSVAGEDVGDVGAGGIQGMSAYDERVAALEAQLYDSQDANDELEQQLRTRMEEYGLEYDELSEVGDRNCGAGSWPHVFYSCRIRYGLVSVCPCVCPSGRSWRCDWWKVVSRVVIGGRKKKEMVIGGRRKKKR